MPNKSEHNGKVILVGAGPGHPGLITREGLEAIRQADVIVYDNLANPSLLEENPDAEKIYVGKQAGAHTLKQHEINNLLVDQARTGKTIVRLKGGDPYVFGRGGEEALELQKADIPFRVIPGITAGIAGLAYAGIPATHRGLATAVTFVTGHEDPTKPDSQLDWQAIANLHGTLVFYMGVRNVSKIVDQLLKFGKSADTPAALVRHGTLPQQQTVTGTLENISQRAEAAELSPPALIVIGEVVRLRDQLSWFENKPLFGKRIVVTRSRAQASDFADQLQELGAGVLMVPTIKIMPPEDWQPVDETISRIEAYDYLIFTSVNGVSSFFGRLSHHHLDARALANAQVWAIGPATAQRLGEFGITADVQPEKFVAESILDMFKNINIRNKKILLPRADIARPTLREGLEEMGAQVDEVTVYKTVVDENQPPETLERVRCGEFDLVTFTSSSTVHNFVSVIGKDHLLKSVNTAHIACIGPITRSTAESFGLNVSIQPDNYTIPDFVDAIVRFYTEQK